MTFEVVAFDFESHHLHHVLFQTHVTDGGYGGCKYPPACLDCLICRPVDVLPEMPQWKS